MSSSDGERVEIGLAHRLRGLERAAAAEHAEPREELLLVGSSSRSYDHAIVARSVECRSSASRVPLSASSRSPSRSRSASGASSFVRAAASSIASGSRSSRSQSSATAAVPVDVRPHGSGAFAEELHRVVVNERRKVELRLALNTQRLAARRDEPQRGSGGRELGQWASCAGQEMLEVVADDVGPALADASGDRRRIRGRRAQPVGQRR